MHDNLIVLKVEKVHVRYQNRIEDFVESRLCKPTKRSRVVTGCVHAICPREGHDSATPLTTVDSILTLLYMIWHVACIRS